MPFCKRSNSLTLVVYSVFVTLTLFATSAFAQGAAPSTNDVFVCTATAHSSSRHLFWIPGFGKDFVEDTNNGGVTFVTFDDGTARITGAIKRRSDSNAKFNVDVFLSGRLDPGDSGHAPSGSPKKAGSSNYAPDGPLDPSTWTYFTNLNGTLTGDGNLAGVELSITRKGPSAQLGFGANVKNHKYGFSNWFNWSVVSNTNNLDISETGYGDINLNLIDCEACPATGTDKYRGSSTHAFWFPGVGTDFIEDEDMGGLEYYEYNGKARLYGFIERAGDTDKKFWVDVLFSGRVNPGDSGHSSLVSNAKRELPADEYYDHTPPGPVDPNTWYFFEGVFGQMLGKEDFAGVSVLLNRRGPAAQVGFGANNKNLLWGLSVWLKTDVIKNLPGSCPPPSDEDDEDEFATATLEGVYCKPALEFGNGDINIDLDECAPEKPECRVSPAQTNVCDDKGVTSATVSGAIAGNKADYTYEWVVECTPDVANVTGSNEPAPGSSDPLNTDVSFEIDAVANGDTNCTVTLKVTDEYKRESSCDTKVLLEACDPIQCTVSTGFQCEAATVKADFSSSVSPHAQGVSYSWGYNCDGLGGTGVTGQVSADTYGFQVNDFYAADTDRCDITLDIVDNIGRKASCNAELAMEGCGNFECEIQAESNDCGDAPGGASFSLTSNPDVSQVTVDWTSDCGGEAYTFDVAGDNASAKLSLNDFHVGSIVSCSASASITDGRNKAECGKVVDLNPCELECQDQDISALQTSLDGGAKALERIIRRGTKSLRRSGFSKKKARNMNNKAHDLQFDNWVLSWTLESTQTDCQNQSAAICVASSNQPIVDGYKANNDGLLKLARRVARVLRKNGNTKLAKFVRKKALRKHKQLDALSDTVPTVDYNCSGL